MQDRYAGDVGDFGKLGLLRHLTAGNPPLRLGVLWYRVADESHNNDGRHTSYLTSDAKPHAELRACDPPLASSLATMLASGERSIAALENAAGLPDTTRFHGTPLDLADVPVVDRPRVRDAWFASALSAVEHSDLVFLDPDNGLEAKSATEGQARIVKYARYADLEALRARSHSLVVYHHLGRSGGTHPEQVATLRNVLEDRLQLPARPTALTFRKGSARTFFIIPAPAHERALAERLAALAQTRWASVFERAPDERTPALPQTESERFWYARGREHARRHVLRQMLSARFGNLPPEFDRRLEDADDESLSRWIDRVLDGPTLDELLD